MMGEFFRGWRRKLGVLTLVMALLFAGFWVRGEFITDYFSSCSWIASPWGLILENGQRLIHIYGSHKPKIDGPNSMRVMFEGEDYVLEIVDIPHWCIAVPLTLISAFLLLRKPHKSTQKKIAEPIPDEGT